MDTSFINWLIEIILLMLEGFKLTLELFIITLIFSIPIGLILCFTRNINSKSIGFIEIFKTILKKCRSLFNGKKYKLYSFLFIIKSFLCNLVSIIIGAFIHIMRGTPLLLQIFFVYYGFPYLPGTIGDLLTFDRFSAGVVAFSLNYAAYFAEIFRGGLLAVDNGQYEASKVLGITPLQTKLKIIMPQMFRIALPSLSNETVILLKDTALVTSIGLTDLLKITTSTVNRTTDIKVFGVAAAFYLVVSYVLILIFNKLEKKFSF